eukprot:4413306-Prymnesium_polylepis.1
MSIRNGMIVSTVLGATLTSSLRHSFFHAQCSRKMAVMSEVHARMITPTSSFIALSTEMFACIASSAMASDLDGSFVCGSSPKVARTISAKWTWSVLAHAIKKRM